MFLFLFRLGENKIDEFSGQRRFLLYINLHLGSDVKDQLVSQITDQINNAIDQRCSW